jgi:hypothetical protein
VPAIPVRSESIPIVAIRKELKAKPSNGLAW